MPDHAPTTHRTTSRARKLVWLFFGISSLITVVIIYLSAVKTTITISRTVYPVRSTFLVHIGEAKDEQTLSGSLEIQTLTHSMTSSDLGTQTTEMGKATGSVRITNNWSQPQPLQAGTRFLTSEGILFRSVSRVDVPAGGSVDAELVADQDGAQGDINENTTLTIPGLWKGLQESIYATSTQKFSGGEKKVTILTEDEIKKLIDATLDQLDENAKTQAQQKAGSASTIFAMRTGILSQQADGAPGSKATSLTVHAKARYAIVKIATEKLHERLLKELQKSLTDEEEIASFDMNTLDVTINAADEKTQSVDLKISVVGNAQLLKSSRLFDASRFTDKSESQLTAMTSNEVGIESLTANFAPFWVKKTPSIATRIKIIVK